MLGWDEYTKIAERFQHKARGEDREDLKQEIILNLAIADRQNGHKPDNLSWAYRIASFTVSQYWRDYYRLTNGIDCGHCSNPQRKRCKDQDLYRECPKAIRIESLNKPIVDGEGNITELGELIADDKAIDLDAWLDAKTWLLGCPKRLVEIAHKRVNRIPLTATDDKYLDRFRKGKRRQMSLF